MEINEWVNYMDIAGVAKEVIEIHPLHRSPMDNDLIIIKRYQFT